MPHPEHCTEHGEAIAAILEGIKSIEEHLRRLNGRVGKGEDAIMALTVKQSAHDVIQTTIMGKLVPLETSMGKLKDWRASVKGGADTTAKLFRDWAMLIGLAVALWQGWIQREALRVQIDQVRQAQTQQVGK